MVVVQSHFMVKPNLVLRLGWGFDNTQDNDCHDDKARDDELKQLAENTWECEVHDDIEVELKEDIGEERIIKIIKLVFEMIE